jgi:hypothetical protein
MVGPGDKIHGIGDAGFQRLVARREGTRTFGSKSRSESEWRRTSAPAFCAPAA